MKPIILLLFSIFLWPLNGQKLIVANNTSNVLYVGIENELHIAYDGIKNEDLLVSSNDCKIKHIHNALYKVEIFSEIRECKIRIALKDKPNQYLDSFILPVRNISKGKLLFGTLEGNSYSKEEVLNQDSIRYVVDVFIKNLKYSVLSYNLTFLPKTGELKMFEIKGAQITEKIKSELEHCKNGDIILIDAIKITDGKNLKFAAPFKISINNPQEEDYEFGKLRVEGRYLEKRKAKYYRYPIDRKQFEISNKLVKDSVWNYWQYVAYGLKYVLIRRDSFSKNKLIYSIHYNYFGDKKQFEIRPLTDSTFSFISCYNNGVVRSKGEVRKNTKFMQFVKYKYYDAFEYPTLKEVWEKPLEETPDDLYPIGQWHTYDEKGSILSSVNYSFKLTDANLESAGNAQYYLIILDGECLIYDQEILQKRLTFKNGELIK